MKRKTTSRNGMKIQELTAKALRRGDKLANTLRKLVTKSGSSDASFESLLKELEKALPRLRRLSDQHERLPARQDAERVGRVSKAGHELAAPPKSRSRKAKRPTASAPAAAE